MPLATALRGVSRARRAVLATTTLRRPGCAVESVSKRCVPCRDVVMSPLQLGLPPTPLQFVGSAALCGLVARATTVAGAALRAVLWMAESAPVLWPDTCNSRQGRPHTLP